MSRQLVVEQHVSADAARAFSAWTSAESLATWWWPDIPDTTYEVDARVGGRYEIRSAAMGIGARGEFLEVDEPRAMRMTFCWMGPGANAPEEQLYVAFAPTDDGTLVTLTHDLAQVAGAGETIRHGWEEVLARLAEVCAGSDSDDTAVPQA